MNDSRISFSSTLGRGGICGVFFSSARDVENARLADLSIFGRWKSGDEEDRLGGELQEYTWQMQMQIT